MKIEETKKEAPETKKEKCCDVINPDVIKALEDQLSQELYNMQVYQKFASYFNLLGLDNLSRYYNQRSKEEFIHYSEICKFLNDNMVEYSFNEVKKVDVKIEDSIDPFKLTLELEYDTTESIYSIYDQAHSEQDYITLQWLMQPEGLIAEQSEELKVSTKALEIANMNLDWISKSEAILNLL